jgi:glycosyltransferase involved in cell wall biosynthesis
MITSEHRSSQPAAPAGQDGIHEPGGLGRGGLFEVEESASPSAKRRHVPDESGLEITRGSLAAVIPVFGSPDHIDECLRSVSAQQVPFDLVVLVDDSQDPLVLELLMEWRSRHGDWLIIQNREPLGIVGSTNLGVEAAHCEFVALIDCDDLVLPNASGVIREYMASASVSYICSRHATFQIDKGFIDFEVQASPDYLPSYESDEMLVLEHLFLSHLKVAKREWFLAKGGFAEGTDGVQDWFLGVDAVQEQTYQFADEVVYLHRLHGRQTTRSNRPRFLQKVNDQRRRILLGEASRPLSQADHRAIEVVVSLLLREPSQALKLPPFFVSHGRQGLRALPASVPIIDAHIAQAMPNWILVAGDGWVNLAQLSSKSRDRSTLLGLLVHTAAQSTLDMAKWYSGYLDFLVVPTQAQALALHEYLPIEVPVLIMCGARHG